MVEHLNRTQDVPHDRLTRIGKDILTNLENHPEAQHGDKCIVMLHNGKMGGIALHGYENETEAIADMFVHMQAMFGAIGKELQIITIPNDIGGMEGG